MSCCFEVRESGFGTRDSGLDTRDISAQPASIVRPLHSGLSRELNPDLLDRSGRQRIFSSPEFRVPSRGRPESAMSKRVAAA